MDSDTARPYMMPRLRRMYLSAPYQSAVDMWLGFMAGFLTSQLIVMLVWPWPHAFSPWLCGGATLVVLILGATMAYRWITRFRKGA